MLPVLQRSQAKCVHFMFVTPEAGRLQTAVGAGRATFGMAAVLATLDDDGRLGLTIPKTKAMQGDQRWVDLFEMSKAPLLMPVLFTHHLRNIDEESGRLQGALTDLQVQHVRRLITQAGQRFDYTSLPDMAHNMNQTDPGTYASILRNWTATLGN